MATTRRQRRRYTAADKRLARECFDAVVRDDRLKGRPVTMDLDDPRTLPRVRAQWYLMAQTMTRLVLERCKAVLGGKAGR